MPATGCAGRSCPSPRFRWRATSRQLDFQPRGNLLLVRYDKFLVTLWSWRDGERLPWAEKLAGVVSAQFSPDGSSVALGFLSGEMQIRNAITGAILANTQQKGEVAALAFSPDGKFLAIAGLNMRHVGIFAPNDSHSGLEPSSGESSRSSSTGKAIG